MLEALAAIVFRVKDRRKSEEPVNEERRVMTGRQAHKSLSDSIDRLQDAVRRNLK